MKLVIRQGTFPAYRAGSNSVQAKLKSLLAGGCLIESEMSCVFTSHYAGSRSCKVMKFLGNSSKIIIYHSYTFLYILSQILKNDSIELRLPTYNRDIEHCSY